jgi:hypothetical protein
MSAAAPQGTIIMADSLFRSNLRDAQPLIVRGEGAYVARWMQRRGAMEGEQGAQPFQ